MDPFALERGLVKVRVNHKVASCLELAVALRQRYSLMVCEVVPVNADSADQVLRKIAVTAAQVMESYLGEVQPKIIALGSGQTIKAGGAKTMVPPPPVSRRRIRTGINCLGMRREVLDPDQIVGVIGYDKTEYTLDGWRKKFNCRGKKRSGPHIMNIGIINALHQRI